MTHARRRRRIVHNALIAAVSPAVGSAVAMLAYDRTDLRSQVSVATAYVGLGCVALSLMLGPLNLLRGRPNPLSSDLRRDLGIWGGVVGLVHFAVGLTVHMRGRMHLYFLAAPDSRTTFPLRLDAFGASNYLGLLSGVVLLMLVALSRDTALRRLGAPRWKRLQQLNYVGALALVGHGALYQIIERRKVGFVVILAFVIAATVCLQALGYRLVLHRQRGRSVAWHRHEIIDEPDQ